MTPVITLFTDFGTQDPYVGQLHMVLAQVAPEISVVDLFHHVPGFDIRAGSYLLPAYTRLMQKGSICVAVVDPGVGGDRKAIAVKADGRWYVGPDNGLFSILARQSNSFTSFNINWRPENLSDSFHARDLFAPVAVMLSRNQPVDMEEADLEEPEGDWPDDLPAILYFDNYGNAITGTRSGSYNKSTVITCAGRDLRYARIFSELGTGEAFWYENANGLVELSVNHGSFKEEFNVCLGDGYYFT